MADVHGRRRCGVSLECVGVVCNSSIKCRCPMPDATMGMGG